MPVHRQPQTNKRNLLPTEQLARSASEIVGINKAVRDSDHLHINCVLAATLSPTDIKHQ